MKVIAEAGNKSYFITRAIEMLRTDYDNADTEARGLQQSIQLLVLALVELEDGQAKVKDKR